MSLKNAFITSLLAAGALWAAPALAEDSYRTVQPDAKGASRSAVPLKGPATEAAVPPAVGGSGMAECIHMREQRPCEAQHPQPRPMGGEGRTPRGGHSLHPSTGPEPLTH